MIEKIRQWWRIERARSDKEKCWDDLREYVISLGSDVDTKRYRQMMDDCERLERRYAEMKRER